MARVLKTAALLLLAAALAAGLWRWLGPVAPPPASPSAGPSPGGGNLVSSIRSEPRTFNRFVGRDSISETIAHLTHAKLVRIDRVTQTLEPWLAESWTASEDGLTFTVKLRRALQFSDGTPFTSADVLFSFRAVYDPKTASPLADSLSVEGKPLEVSAPDEATVVIRFPAPFGPGLRLLDNLPILPRHRLEGALAAGALAGAWGLDTPPAELAGLGPFVVERYEPGQRLVFKRNSYYWRKDDTGYTLPYLDRITLEIVPDQNAELLRLQSGQIDFPQSEIRPEDAAGVKRAADAGRLVLYDLGVGLDPDSLWFNLDPRRGTDTRRGWVRRTEVRQAISRGVDREAFVDAVFLGAAVPVAGPVTSANARWHASDLPIPEPSTAEARKLLETAGLSDANGDGLLEDPSGQPARITLLTQKGNTALERGALFVRDEMKKAGLTIDVAPLEVGALIDRLERGDYEAVYFRFLTTDLDPALNLDFWMSRGGAHVWCPAQAKPATEWEAAIDDLMRQQVSALDQDRRKALFVQVQHLFARELPIIHFAAPRVMLATSARVRNVTPSVLRPSILWNSDMLAVTPNGAPPPVR